MFQGLWLAVAMLFAITAHAEVTAKGAWVRGTVPAQTSTGAYVTFSSTPTPRS
jgi:copper(I)-binding protein